MNLLKDNIPKLVRKLALPAMVGTLFQTLYNIVDTFFAGKISPEALSALSKSFPIYFIIVATLTRGARFFLIAFLIGNFGPAMKKIIEKKLLTVSIVFSIVIIIFAYFVYNFLIKFTS